MTEFNPIDPKKASKEQIEKGLALLNKKLEYEAKVKSGEVKAPKKWKDLSLEEKDKARKQAKVYAARLKAISALKDAKLAAAKISLTEAEIQAEIKKMTP